METLDFVATKMTTGLTRESWDITVRKTGLMDYDLIPVLRGLEKIKNKNNKKDGRRGPPSPLSNIISRKILSWT
jgi:hypothetical protein